MGDGHTVHPAASDEVYIVDFDEVEYERIFLDRLPASGRVTSEEFLGAYRAEGLRHSTGRILAGVTGGITKKLQRTGIKDFWVADYDGEVRRWTFNPKYAVEARDTFTD